MLGLCVVKLNVIFLVSACCRPCCQYIFIVAHLTDCHDCKINRTRTFLEAVLLAARKITRGHAAHHFVFRYVVNTDFSSSRRYEVRLTHNGINFMSYFLKTDHFVQKGWGEA